MLDKLSKRILRHMQKELLQGNNIYHDFDEDLNDIASTVSSDSESVRAAIRYLKKKEYIEYSYSDTGLLLYFYLDHKGLHW